MNNLPNRKERRKLAKELGLFGKKGSDKSKADKSSRSSAMGKMIHLRNLTEQRNQERIRKQGKAD